MVLGGATSKIRQQALISLHSQSRHSRAAVEGEGVSVSEKQVGSGEEPLQGPLWQGLSPPEPARRKALAARAQGFRPTQPGRASREGHVNEHTGFSVPDAPGQKAPHAKGQPHPAAPGPPDLQARSVLACRTASLLPALNAECSALEPHASELAPGKLWANADSPLVACFGRRHLSNIQNGDNPHEKHDSIALNFVNKIIIF